MLEAKVYEGLTEIFADVFLRDDIPLHAGLSAKDVEGWDSFKNIEIIMATEEKFAMKFSSADSSAPPAAAWPASFATTLGPGAPWDRRAPAHST